MIMLKTRMIAVAVCVICLATNAFAQDITAGEIFKNVADTYERLHTYKAEGTIVSDMDIDGTKMKVETSFSILLKKPNMYLISWTQSNMPMLGMFQSGTVWSDGTQPYLYMGVKNEYAKMKSDEAALASAAGISGGAASTIPLLFLSVFKERPAPFSWLKDPKVEKSEKVGEEDCYVISGASMASEKETYWISKSRYLIAKCARSLAPPEGGMEIPEMTNERLDDTLKLMGRDVTEENRKSLREMMNVSRNIVKTTKVKGVSTETHTKISSPELNKTDFEFEPPKDAVLKDTLFGGIFGGDK